MNTRLLTVLNAVGCLVLIGFIVIQWQQSQKLSDQLRESRSREILQDNARVAAESMVKQLQSDIEGLKASVESIQQSATVADQESLAKAAETQALAAQVARAQEQVVAWEAAVKERDEAIALRDAKLQQLNEALVATRKRLDQAVAELKSAGAR